MSTILIVDDDEAFRESLAETLIDLGHTIQQSVSGREALAFLAENTVIDCVFLDFKLPDMNGIEVLEKLRAMPARHTLAVVMLTGYATSENTIDAMRMGAFDHLTKPVGRVAIVELLRKIGASATRSGAAPALSEGLDAAPRLLGTSDVLRDVQKQIGRAAMTDSTVLITGETGTGKEVAARVLHDVSKRKDGPFIAINCAAIPDELLESELFGHVKGAFTGAVSERPGRFIQAHGGTLFLDEIGDLPLAMQAKILRAIQERVVTPLGGDKTVAIDVRIIAATHRELALEVAAQTFREDLFYRLNVIPLLLPPLRDRPADIVPLATHFLALTAANGGPSRALSASAEARLLQHPWPGNVRELRNAIERVVALARGAQITDDDLAFLVAPVRSLAASEVSAALLDLPLPEAIERLERASIARALTMSGGNRAEAARKLGISRQSLYTKLAAFKLG